MQEQSQRSSQRATNACRNCKRRKIRCSAKQPCSNCTRRGIECRFDDQGRKLVVSEKYLRRLQRASHSEGDQVDPRQGPIRNSPSRTLSVDETSPTQESCYRSRTEHTTPSMFHGRFLRTPTTFQSPGTPLPEPTNPMASATSAYVSDDSGRLRCLGESSTWSFARKTLMSIRDHLDDLALHQEVATNEESRAYDLRWGVTDVADPANFAGLPSADYARYLVNGVNFHTGRLYHLFDEETFMKPLDGFYKAPAQIARDNRIWYIQFLVVLALGKALVIQPMSGESALPGSDLFIRGMSLLPDTSYLFSDALTSVETLCAIALYLQCADMRNSAYVHIGSALRIAMVFGLHRERPTHDWSPEVTQRCQRAWWTVYILDRTFSSSMGVPISIQDSDITTSMPTRAGSSGSTSLYIHVKLSNLISEVVNKVYGPEGRLQKSFLPCVQQVLGTIATIANDLNECFPLSLAGIKDSSTGGISRVAAHLHLFYHQTILLTMYPLLLYLFGTKLESGSSTEEPQRELSNTTKALLLTCGESCRKVTGVLGALQKQNLIGGALPFDLERAFSSGFVSAMISFVNPDDRTASEVPSVACQLLDELSQRGCAPAQLRKSEIEHLQEMIVIWKTGGSLALDSVSKAAMEDRGDQGQPSVDSLTALPLTDSFAVGLELFPEQMLSLADMVDFEQDSVHTTTSANWVDDWMWD